MKSLNVITNYPGPKYKKVSFSNPGHAHNLAQKLNELFNSEDFAVYKLTTGETVTVAMNWKETYTKVSFKTSRQKCTK